ncbi:unnamed protein product, partial [Prunus brigantina]
EAYVRPQPCHCSSRRKSPHSRHVRSPQPPRPVPLASSRRPDPNPPNIFAGKHKNRRWHRLVRFWILRSC